MSYVTIADFQRYANILLSVRLLKADFDDFYLAKTFTHLFQSFKALAL